MENKIVVIDKRCVQCMSIKLVSEFAKDKHTKTGLTSYCKPCIKIKNAKIYKQRKCNAIAEKQYYLIRDGKKIAE